MSYCGTYFRRNGRAKRKLLLLAMVSVLVVGLLVLTPSRYESQLTSGAMVDPHVRQSLDLSPGDYVRQKYNLMEETSGVGSWLKTVAERAQCTLGKYANKK